MGRVRQGREPLHLELACRLLWAQLLRRPIGAGIKAVAQTNLERRSHHPLRPVGARRYLIFACLIGVGAFLGCRTTRLETTTAALLAWDAGIIFFLGLVFRSMVKSDLDQMRQRANELDQGKYATLALTMIAVTASVVAIAGELVTAKRASGLFEIAQISLAVVTIALSWALAHITFALHYAHEFYLGDDDTRRAKLPQRGGLEFPNDSEPDYWDFVHFALVLGAAAQTADIQITSKRMRRLATIHTLIAFTFNTAILAVMINVVAGLLQ